MRPRPKLCKAPQPGTRGLQAAKPKAARNQIEPVTLRTCCSTCCEDNRLDAERLHKLSRVRRVLLFGQLLSETSLLLPHGGILQRAPFRCNTTVMMLPSPLRSWQAPIPTHLTPGPGASAVPFEVLPRQGYSTASCRCQCNGKRLELLSFALPALR